MTERDWSWRTAGYAWWVVAVLALGLTLALMDRMIIALLIQPIKRDLALSDTQISLLHGLAFTITYVLAGLPLGRIADRGHRSRLAAGSIVFWSVMTGLCGVAGTFYQLFLARLGVGVGEAGLSPAALSLVSDYFPPEKRTRPIAFLTIGTTAGAGLALIGGGWIVQAVGGAGSVSLPLFGDVRTWQAVFLLLGFGGILFAAIFLTVREPPRHEGEAVQIGTVADVYRHLRDRRGFFVPQLLGPALAVLTLIAFHSWMPAMLMRRFGWTIALAGLAYGALIMVAGCLGVIVAGAASDRLVSRGRPDGAQRVALAAATMAFPLLVAAPLMTSPTVMLILLFPALGLLAIPSTLAPAALQAATPNRMRGQVFAVYLLILSFLGYAVGPLAVALVTDKVLADESAVHLSLAIVAAVAIPGCIACLALARRRAAVAPA